MSEGLRRWTRSHVVWVPHGMFSEDASARLTVGVLLAGEVGACWGLVDLDLLDAVADALPGCARLGAVDRAMIGSILRERLTPEQAHERFPGQQAHCSQNWAVTPPKALRSPYPPGERLLTVHLRRYTGLPLHTVVAEPPPG